MNELTREQIDRFLDTQTIGRLGCIDDGAPYVVPLIYARHGDALYVLATDGRKNRAARANPAVCFEVDEYDRATGNWTSVVVWGRYEELDEKGKADAIGYLRGRFGGRRPASEKERPKAPERPVLGFRIVIESATGRAVTR